MAWPADSRHQTSGNGSSANVDRDALPSAGSQALGPGVAASVWAVVKAAISAVRKAGEVSVSAVRAAIEAPGRVLTQRVAANAVGQPRPVAHPDDLARALAKGPTAPILGSATAAAFAARAARRFRPFRFFTRRAPLWILASAIPALHASVTRGAEELGLVASHLVHRARAAGVEPDPERVRRAAIQVMSGRPFDPNRDPGHVPLIGSWLQRAVKATLPMAGGVTTADPDILVNRARAIPPQALGGPYVTTAS